MTPAEIKALADEWAERIAYDEAHYPPVDPLFVKTEAALRSFMDGRWRPIETAPKDGTKFDGWQRDERVTDMYWSDVQDAWCVDGVYGPDEPTPLAVIPPVTHWRPLPTPPAVEGEAGADPR